KKGEDARRGGVEARPFSRAQRGAHPLCLGQRGLLRRAPGARTAAPCNVEEESGKFRKLAVPALLPRQLLSFGSLLADRAAMLFHVALAARRLEAETAGVAARRDLAKDTGLQSQHPFGD